MSLEIVAQMLNLYRRSNIQTLISQKLGILGAFSGKILNCCGCQANKKLKVCQER
jgi:hypothetical protein